MFKAMFPRTLAVLFAALALALPVRAAEAPKPPQSYAILVGISDYADKQIKPRAHAEADAAALYDVLTNKDHLGIKSDNLRLLLGKKDAKRGSQDATRENVLKALQWVSDNAGPDDLVIFAFFGEGGPLGEAGD